MTFFHHTAFCLSPGRHVCDKDAAPTVMSTPFVIPRDPLPSAPYPFSFGRRVRRTEFPQCTHEEHFTIAAVTTSPAPIFHSPPFEKVPRGFRKPSYSMYDGLPVTSLRERVSTAASCEGCATLTSSVMPPVRDERYVSRGFLFTPLAVYLAHGSLL